MEESEITKTVARYLAYNYQTIENYDVQEYISDLIKNVNDHKHINVFLNCLSC